MNNKSILALGLCIFLGFASLGYFISSSILQMKSMERTVVVKGLAEKEVMANKVVWPISFNITGNTLEEIHNKHTLHSGKIVTLLTNNGIPREEITISTPNIEDKTTYASQGNMPLFKYMVYANIIVSSNDVEKVSKATEMIGILVKEGIVLSRNNGDLQYSFTELNALKPAMIEEATKNAREVAERFAKDSESFLGKIRKANQGLFSITTPDRYKPQMKQIRVVSTVEYYLVD